MHRPDASHIDAPSPPVAPAAGATFPIVGIGASAGGLEAVTQLLTALPPDTGLGFVLVQHLAPLHPSALADILSRATRMPVTEVEDECPVEPNHVYVIPPARSMVISGGLLQLFPRPQGIHRPVDQFFRALAEDRRHLAIGVILSGTANDGTMGLEAIKAEGGLTFAQDVTAQHDGMPHSAIASGSVDFVLPPEEIARELVRIAQHPSSLEADRARESGERPVVTRILQVLRDATGVDFTQYKFNTLYRRIARRALLRRAAGLGEYMRILQETPEEASALYQDILIGVTSFFRDAEAFEFLKATVFPALVQQRTGKESLRVWSLGCSTGQEAYSVAIAYAEYAEEAGTQVPLQIFATDLSNASIDTARAGHYRTDITEEVSPGRLRRFFVQEEDGYRIKKAIRDSCIFSRHNVGTDPPFSRIDLISCRNLLIYLEPALQQRILPILHYALKPAGVLWLGSSETIGSHRNLFDVQDGKHRIYVKKAGPAAATGLYPVHARPVARVPFSPLAAHGVNATPDLPKEADRILAAKFAPPGVLVSAELDILQFRGDTGPFLSPSPGKASLSLLKMLREGLLVGVREAVLKARRDGVTVRQDGLRIDNGEDGRAVDVEVIPLGGSGSGQAGFLILFQHEGTMPTPTDARGLSEGTPGEVPAARHDAAHLGHELAATRDYLQTVVEQHEASSEELQSANEEIQSANEELQSINEELETSKEEIQSSNEELVTVNEELNHRNMELGRVNNDLTNLLGSVQVPIVIVGHDFRIRRFTAAAERLLKLIPSDVGRPLADINLNLANAPDLEPLLVEVLETVSTLEREVQDRRGCWYALRLRPYKTSDNRIDGVVIMWVDIDTMKRAHDDTASIVATVREPLLVLEDDLRVRSASGAFYRIFQVTPEETIGRFLFDLGKRQWDVPELRRLLLELLPRHTEVKNFELERDFEHLGHRTMILNARQLLQVGGKPAILLAIEDSTEWKQLDEALRASEAGLRFTLESAQVGAWEIDLPTGTARHSLRHDKAFGYTEPVTEWNFDIFLQHVYPADRAEVESHWQRTRLTLEDLHFECRVTWPDGSLHWIEVHACSYVNQGGKASRIMGIVADVTDRKRSEEVFRERALQMGEADRRKDEFLAMLAHELRNPLAPIRNALQVVKLAGEPSSVVIAATQMIERQVGQIVRLVDDLLDVSRITRGMIELRREWLDIGTLVGQAIEGVRPLCEQFDQHLVIVQPPEELHVSADPVRLGQVVGNLLHNACKFTNRGGRITITLERDGGDAVVRVHDTGIGLAADRLSDIFELFTQVDASLERSGSGLGIGLTLVRQLAEAHGGTVYATSAGVGQGSEFVLRLPLAEAPVLLRPAARPSSDGPGRRILIVDDNRDAADSLALLLQMSGHTTAVVYDGHAAIREAPAFHPDVILLDIGLPGMNGLEVGRRIRQEDWGKDIVLIALTGWGQDDARRASSDAGFQSHLVKPVELAHLLDVLGGTPVRESRAS